MLMIKQIQLYCQLASQLSAFSSLNVPVAKHGLTVTIKLMVMCWAMLSSYLSKRSINTVHYRNNIIATATQLVIMQTLLNKQIQLAIQPRTQLYTQQLATNLHVCTILSFLHSMSQQTWSIHCDQITGGVLGQHSTYDTHILNNYTCDQPRHTREFTNDKLASNTRVPDMRVLPCS